MTNRQREILTADEVQLWSGWLDARAGQLACSQAVLSGDERARADRLRRPRDRARWIAARATLRRVLSRYLSLAPGELRFRSGARGKPALDIEASELISFNLSHSGELLLLAVTRRREVGVDVERTDRVRSWERVARRFFSSTEQQALSAVAPNRRQQMFLRLWTRREALGKALGEGVFHSLRRMDLASDLATIAAAAPGAAGRQLDGWWLHESEPAPGYVAALVVEGSACTVVHRSYAASPSIESTGMSGTGGGTASDDVLPDHQA